MDLHDDRDALSQAYKLLAALFLSEPDLMAVKHFKEVFQIEITADIDEIVDDFTNLFYSPAEPLSPYESSYLQIADSPVIESDITESVYNAYLEEGLLLDESINIIPDHIAAELSFIGYLIETGRNGPLKLFLEHHAVQWIPQFCDDLYDSAETDFYREVASVTKDIILTEYEELPF